MTNTQTKEYIYCLNDDNNNEEKGKLENDGVYWEAKKLSGTNITSKLIFYRKRKKEDSEKYYFCPFSDNVWEKEEKIYDKQEFTDIMLYFLHKFGKSKKISECNDISELMNEKILNECNVDEKSEDWSELYDNKKNKLNLSSSAGYPYFPKEIDIELGDEIKEKIKSKRRYVNVDLVKNKVIGLLINIGKKEKELPECKYEDIFNDDYYYYIGYLKNDPIEDDKKGNESNEMDEYSADVYEKIKKWIDNGVKQIILTGAPGTGKTKMAKDIANELGEKYEIVQFHPSYDYTDFVEGIRPVGDAEISFRKIDGIFKSFCRNASGEDKKENKYFFIIDEINRADVSKVFGELMYCLEADKRGEENRIKTQYQNIPTYESESKKLSEDVFKFGFYIPENVVIIGTMNDIDRSVESMDFALRRRFMWMEIEVTKELLRGALIEILQCDPTTAEKIADRVNNLNKKVIGSSKYYLGKHYYISQGQFANLPSSITEIVKKDSSDNAVNEFLNYVYDYRLRNLLYEYVRGENNEEEFLKECRERLLKEPEEHQNNDKTNGLY